MARSGRYKICRRRRILGRNKVLQVMRIVQEALTNAMKHSRPSRIIIRTSVESLGVTRPVRLDVVDNGVGLDANPKEGRGLVNMRRRASAKTLTVIGADKNTTIVFPLPIDLISPFVAALNAGAAARNG